MHGSLKSSITQIVTIDALTKEVALHNWETSRFLNHQDHTYVRLTSISWCLDRAAPQLLDVRVEIRCSTPWDLLQREPSTCGCGWYSPRDRAQPYRNKCKAARVCKAHSFFFPAFLPCSFTGAVTLVVGTARQHAREKQKGILSSWKGTEEAQRLS